MVSIFLRSLLFNILFYLVLVILIIVGIPTFLMPRAAIMTVAGWWEGASLFLMRVVCNIKVEFRGLEKIPRGPLLVASKHQSMWETFALLAFFEHPLFILKRELTWIPVFGQFLKKAGMISVERDASPGRRGSAERPSAHSLSRRYTHPRRRAAALQGRGCPDLCRQRGAVPAGGAEFRAVLAAPDVHALSRDAGGGIPRSVAARAAARRVSCPSPHRDRRGDQPHR
jgi:hypothetical protein